MNQPLLSRLHPGDVDVIIQRAEEVEVDEMWSYVGKKTAPRWLWHAIEHQTGKVLAYVCGWRQDQVFLQLKALLEPFGITRYHTPIIGARTPGISILTSTTRASGIRSRSSANI